jgi:hypothetical protein
MRTSNQYLIRGYMRKLCVLIAAVMLFAVFAANVESELVSSDGYELLDTCSYADREMSELNKVERIKARTCVGMMAGISIINKSEQDLGNTKLFFCIPDHADNSDLAEKLVKFLKKNPDKLNRKVNDLIFTAFKKAFPCKPKK